MINIKMKSNNELKEINIKNRIRYYFVDIMNSNDLHADNICLDEKTHEKFFKENSKWCKAFTYYF